MTDMEWLTAKLKELGISKVNASGILGKTPKFLSTQGKKLDSWAVFCIYTDVANYVKGNKTTNYDNYMRRERKARAREKERARRHAQMIRELQGEFLYE